MRYDFTVIAAADMPAAAEPTWQHLLDTYVSEVNKTAAVWHSVPNAVLDFRPQEAVNTVRAILEHQLLSERRFFAQFVGTQEPPASELLPSGDKPAVADYVRNYAAQCRARLPQFAARSSEWWLEERPFFGGLIRERVWIFWRRVLHTCHHRTQVQTWLRLAGVSPVPAIYGPSGDVTWDDADPTNTVEAAGRS